MNNQFTPRVTDIITYSKEEANRLRNSYIGPEHLLLGIIREGEGKAIEVLFNLQIDLKQLKSEVENRLKSTDAEELPQDGARTVNSRQKLRLSPLEQQSQYEYADPHPCGREYSEDWGLWN